MLIFRISAAWHGVGYQACSGRSCGHTTWTCRTCDETVYGPPLNTHC